MVRAQNSERGFSRHENFGGLLVHNMLSYPSVRGVQQKARPEKVCVTVRTETTWQFRE